MKKVLFLLLFACVGLGLQAQDPVKDIKKAARLLGTYNLDPSGSADKLQEAVSLANANINDPLVKIDPTAWQTYGDIFMTVVNTDVAHFVIDPAYKVADPMASGKAFKGFKMAAELADKSYQTKDAMKGLSAGIQNIYYMGSALYQTQNYAGAYDAFKATYDGYALLKKNNEPTNFDATEQPKALYYSGLCAQQAGMMEEAKTVYKQLVDQGIAEAGVYEALINLYKDEDPALSEQYLKAAREKYPDDTALLYAEINHLLAKGELVSLVEKLEQAAALDPNNVSIYITLGQIYDKLYQDQSATDPAAAEESFTKAMSYYQQALVKDAKSFDAVYSIGALWYNKAAAYSLELNALSNDYTPAGTKKYDAKKVQMDDAFVKALPFFQQAEELSPKDINTLIALKEIYARQDKFDLVEAYKQKLAALGN
ncbi:MAG: hypothetical protein IPN60_05595 [Saprospiraceae bacterium]|nr:hypothetical protein [Candidatus Opimibacter skivensis]MBP6681485.1 hypothetical protein [Saprospiraceae bacterium]MBP8086543.1 hypothetical protein [Saprospiraceae bacterium]